MAADLNFAVCVSFREGKAKTKQLRFLPFITCRAKLLNADWLRQRASFLNQEGTSGNQEGMIT